MRLSNLLNIPVDSIQEQALDIFETIMLYKREGYEIKAVLEKVTTVKMKDIGV